jgi:twitching motility protein PilT
MQCTEWPVTRAEVFQGWLQEILTPQKIDGFNRDKEFDGSHAFPFVRVRINLMDSLRGPAMVLRLIPQTILTMEQLHLPSVLHSLAARPKGLILVTGPTGSGKSTTLAAMIGGSTATRHATSSRSRILSSSCMRAASPSFGTGKWDCTPSNSTTP